MKELRVLVIFVFLALGMISIAVADGNVSIGDNETAINDSEDSEIVALNESGSDLNETGENETVVAPAPLLRNRNITIVKTTKLQTFATAYCEKLGYVSMARTDSTGKEYRVCAFPDGRECHEMEFLTGYCGKEYKNMKPEEVRRLFVEKLKSKMKERNCGEDRCQFKIDDKNMSIRELSDEQREIVADKINARTGLNLTADDVDGELALKAYLSNGRWALVKYMPDSASDKAMERLNAKCGENNCTIELKEVGNGEKSRLAYVVSTEKDSKVLLLFKKKMPVVAQVDAESGDIISVKKPWWAFIAKE